MINKSFNNIITSSTYYLNSKFIETVSSKLKYISIIALSILITYALYNFYRTTYCKGRILGESAEKLRQNKEYKEAAKQFKDGLEHDPSDMFNLTRYVKTLFSLNKKDKALRENKKVIAHYKRVIENNPKNAIALREHAKALLLELTKTIKEKKLTIVKEIFKEMSQEVKKTIEIAPQDIASLQLDAKILFYQIDFEKLDFGVDHNEYCERIKEVLERTKQIVKMDPDNIKWRKKLAKAYYLNNKPEKHYQQFEKILEINPNEAETLSDMGFIFLCDNKFNKAILSFEKSLKFRPNNYSTMKYYAKTLIKLNKCAEAAVQYKKILMSHPDDFECLKKYSNVLQTLKQYENAAKQYEKMLEIKPKNFDCLMNYGNVLLTLQRPKDAVEQYEKALKNYPDYTSSWGTMSDIRELIKKIDKKTAI